MLNPLSTDAGNTLCSRTSTGILMMTSCTRVFVIEFGTTIFFICCREKIQLVTFTHSCLPRVVVLSSQNSSDDGADYLYGASAGMNDTVVLAGFTEGDFSAQNLGGADFAAVKLDADGQQLWSWQASGSIIFPWFLALEAAHVHTMCQN